MWQGRQCVSATKAALAIQAPRQTARDIPAVPVDHLLVGYSWIFDSIIIILAEDLYVNG